MPEQKQKILDFLETAGFLEDFYSSGFKSPYRFIKHIGIQLAWYTFLHYKLKTKDEIEPYLFSSKFYIIEVWTFRCNGFFCYINMSSDGIVSYYPNYPDLNNDFIIGYKVKRRNGVYGTKPASSDK